MLVLGPLLQGVLDLVVVVLAGTDDIALVLLVHGQVVVELRVLVTAPLLDHVAKVAFLLHVGTSWDTVTRHCARERVCSGFGRHLLLQRRLVRDLQLWAILHYWREFGLVIASDSVHFNINIPICIVFEIRSFESNNTRHQGRTNVVLSRLIRLQMHFLVMSFPVCSLLSPEEPRATNNSS